VAVSSRLVAGLLVLAVGTGLHAMSLQTTLGSQAVAQSLVSDASWERIVTILGGRITAEAGGAARAQIELATIVLIDAVVAVGSCVLGAWWISYRRGLPFSEALADWSLWGWLWWLIPGVWEVAQWFAPESVVRFLAATPQLWGAAMLGGWLATFCALSTRTALLAPDSLLHDGYRVPVRVVLAMAVFVCVFVPMNWQLYNGLLLPHGDSAMYEEHLWNLLHGKGFRSYLDQGLFLGEHIQLVHLLLIPLGYWLWPDHRLLELLGSLILASAAMPVFWIGRRHTGSARAAALLAIAYLLYVPMHFLDIAIDLKTFRPIGFGIPLLLLAIDQWERRRLWTTIVLLLATLSAQEDYSIILACWGAWIALSPASTRPIGSGLGMDAAQVATSLRGADHQKSSDKVSAAGRSVRTFGALLAVLAAVYLLLAVLVVIPWFRSGDEVHFSHYFGDLGNSPSELAKNAITQPGPVLAKLLSGRSLYYALTLLLPLGLLPLLSPGRLAVAAPSFAMLCLLEFDGPVVPLHHFHAPLIPIVVWAAAAGLGRVFAGQAERSAAAAKTSAPISTTASRAPTWAAHFAWTSALAVALFYSLTPVGIPFWDPGSRYYWRSLYVPGKRAELFPKVYALIPRDSRVASTDFVHTRFTHHERSYDYSNFPRKVSNYEPRVPDDTEYIVIDTRHPYSEVHTPSEVRELQREPEKWELLPDTTEGYFIVLKRRSN
jgi:uncharacterized membrane protein